MTNQKPPCAYKAAQNFPSEKYLAKPVKRTVLTNHGKRVLALLAIITLAAGFYMVYADHPWLDGVWR
jgi:hypothetical protein